jgi:hypothetical protein
MTVTKDPFTLDRKSESSTHLTTKKQTRPDCSNLCCSLDPIYLNVTFASRVLSELSRVYET